MNIPIVSLDKIYINPDEENIYFLDCTRINGTNEIISRNNESLDSQIFRISKKLFNREIVIADDVIFSGSVLRNIINRFSLLGVKVVGVISSICTQEAYDYFNIALENGIKTNYILENDVIDQICERDFYFGIAGSGILVETDDGLVKAPYFKPYGNPCERASIPNEYEKYFSEGCIDRSLYLWESIDKQKNQSTMVRDLPEKIINTYENEEVVKTLKRERRI